MHAIAKNGKLARNAEFTTWRGMRSGFTPIQTNASHPV